MYDYFSIRLILWIKELLNQIKTSKLHVLPEESEFIRTPLKDFGN